LAVALLATMRLMCIVHTGQVVHARSTYASWPPGRGALIGQPTLGSRQQPLRVGANPCSQSRNHKPMKRASVLFVAATLPYGAKLHACGDDINSGPGRKKVKYGTRQATPPPAALTGPAWLALALAGARHGGAVNVVAGDEGALWTKGTYGQRHAWPSGVLLGLWDSWQCPRPGG
jgi:hypothetical protein